MMPEHDLKLAESLRAAMLAANASDAWQVQAQHIEYPDKPGVYGHIHDALETLLRVHGLNVENVMGVLIDSGESVKYAIDYVRKHMNDDD